MRGVYRAPDSSLSLQGDNAGGPGISGAGWTGYVMGEVAMLAARSLEEISEGWVLDLSHMGYLTGLVDELGLRGPSGRSCCAPWAARRAGGVGRLFVGGRADARGGAAGLAAGALRSGAGAASAPEGRRGDGGGTCRGGRA